VHSIADVVSSASIWAGSKIAHRKTRLFPYGLYKVENLVVLITVVLLAGAAYEIVEGVLGPPLEIRPERLPLARGGVVLIVLITWAFSRCELRRGQVLGSPSLVADARHIASDMFAALVILTGLLGSYLELAFPLDRIAALVIVALIAWAAFKIAVDAIRVLLDASLDFPTLDAIREIIGRGIKVGEWLVGLGVDEVIVPRSFAHKGPYYVLADAGSDMRPPTSGRWRPLRASFSGRTNPPPAKKGLPESRVEEQVLPMTYQGNSVCGSGPPITHGTYWRRRFSTGARAPVT